MKRPTVILLWLALVAWFAVPAAEAHDTGLLTLKFEELGDGRYRLEYLARPGTAESSGLPILPEHCTWEEEPPLPGGFMRLDFATDGKPLAADDRILLPWKKNGVLVQAFWRNGETARRFCSLGEEGISLRIGDLRAGAGSTAEAAARYTRLGMERLLLGLDHLFFLAGLLMLAKGWKGIAASLAAFTFSCGASLTLSATGRLRMSPELAAALMALGILFLAAELLRSREGRGGVASRHPWVAALFFGFAQGPVFAEAIVGLGLPSQDLPQALLFYHLGLAGGQLAFVALWFSLAAAARCLSLRVPERGAAYLLGILSAFWLFDRTLTLFA